MGKVLTSLTTWSLLEQLNEGVLVVAADGTIHTMNQAAKKLLGIEREVFSLAEIYDVVAPHETWRQLLDTPFQETYLYTPNGRIHIQARPVQWENQQLIQLLVNADKSPRLTETEPSTVIKQLTALGRISQQLNATLRLEDVLQAVIDEAIRNTDAHGCQISLFDKAENRFLPRMWRGQIPAQVIERESVITAEAKQVIKSRQSMIFKDLPAAENNDISSLLISPIVYEGAVAGLVHLYSTQPDHFNDQSRTFTDALANHAAIAIGNTQRYNELGKRNVLLHRRAQQIERFVESSRVFHGDRPLDEVYEDLVYAIQEGVGFGIVLLSLVDEEDPELRLRRITAAGLPLARLEELQKVRQPWHLIEQLLRPEFALGGAYFIPADQAAAYAGLQISQVGDLYPAMMDSSNLTPVYHVIFIEADESLPVHLEPGADSEIVGSLAFDAQDIHVTGSGKMVMDALWVPITYKEDSSSPTITGWVNKQFLSESASTEQWHENDLFIIPLRGSRDQPLGVISLDVPNDGRRPDINTAQALEIFANQADTAIENVRLLHNTREYANKLQQLHNISQQVLREQDFDRQLDLIVNGLNKTGWRQVALTLRDNDLTITKATFAGLSSEEEEFIQNNMWPPEKWRQLLADEQLENYRLGSCYFLPVTDPWVQQEVGFTPESNGNEGHKDAEVWNPNDMLFLPLYDRQKQVMAIINLDEPDNRRRPNSRALQVIELYAQLATSIIENTQLYQETQRQLAELRTVYEIGQTISTTLELDMLMQKIGQSIAVAYNVNSYYISLYRAEDDTLHFPMIVDEATPLEVEPIKADRGPTNHIFRTGEPLLICRKTDWQILNYEMYGEMPCSYLGVPMRVADRVVGVMTIQAYHQDNAFNKHDISTLSTIASQAGIAIQNARLVTELRDLNEQLDERVAERTQALGEERDRVQILLRITTELSASLDQSHVLNRTLELVNEFANATEGGILLVDPESGKLVYQAVLGLHETEILAGSAIAIKRDEEGLAGWIMRNRTAVVIDDTDTDLRWTGQMDNQNHRSALAVPLIYGDETIGVLMLFHKEPHAFTEQQLELVVAAAAQVANAINNAQLYLLIRDQAERLGTMLRGEQVEAAKNEAILQSIADGVLVANAEGTIILANLPASLILGIPRTRLISKSVTELLGLYGSSGDSWVRTIDNWANRTSQPRQQSSLADQLTIEDKVISVHLSPVFANSQFLGTVSIFRDITKEVEVDRIKSEFVSTVSHELRTPMTSIKGYADLMLMGAAGAMSDPQSRYLKVIKSNADRLSMLVNDLLDISRIETGKTDLDLRPLDVPQIVEQVVEGHLRGRIEHENKKIHVSIEMAPALPLVNADYARVIQILTNLLDNAFHYTPENGQIKVSAQANGEFVAIHVTDTGIGISEENQKKIFDRFFRAEDADVQKVAGTGLGLAIVGSLVEMHGGKITVQSTFGQGSTFTVCLPLVIEDSDSL